jgi:large subunit ribosomal protein L14
MIYKQTILQVVDRTGGVTAKCIKVLGGTINNYGNIGSFIVVVITKGRPNKKVKKGQIYRALIVRTKKGLKRYTGLHIKFGSNAIILLKPNLSPLGKRIRGPIPIELRSKKYVKYISLSKILI